MNNLYGIIGVLILAVISTRTVVTENDYYAGRDGFVDFLLDLFLQRISLHWMSVAIICLYIYLLERVVGGN